MNPYESPAILGHDTLDRHEKVAEWLKKIQKNSITSDDSDYQTWQNWDRWSKAIITGNSKFDPTHVIWNTSIHSDGNENFWLENTYLANLNQEDNRSIIDDLFLHLSGNEVEIRPGSRKCMDNELKDDKFWENWANHKTSEGYGSIIDPEIIRVGITDRNIRNPKVVVDLCGGYGRIINKLKAQNIGTQYVLIDNSTNNIIEAKKIMYDKNTSIHLEDITQINDYSQFTGNQSALYIAEGGLTQQVLTKKQSEIVANRVYDSMNKGDIFVCTGVTFVHLSSEEFKNIGFNVLNMSLPKYNWQGTGLQNFYVLQK